MSSIDYLIKEFSEILGAITTEPMQDLLLVDAINKAKGMHYKELMDSMQRGMELQEKENNRIGFRERNGLLPQQEISDETQPTTYKVEAWTSFHHDKERTINALISDEEIKEHSLFTQPNLAYAFYVGATWYREQLKIKINE